MQRNATWIGTRLALLCSLGGLLLACNHDSGPACATSAECDGASVCAAAHCQALSCETAFFATDPKSGACVPLSSCFMTDEQRGWKSCAADPCQGLSENACLLDSRCQTVYQNPQVDTSGGTMVAVGDCGVVGAPVPGPGPGVDVTAPGVNNGDAPKHPASNGGCFPDSARAYAGCRAVPQVPVNRVPCTSLTKDQCAARRDCSATQPGVQPGGPIVGVGAGSGGSGGAPTPVPPGVDIPATAQCFDRVQFAATCDFAQEQGCLLNPQCQPIGSKCYCPAGGKCECGGGSFLGCENNDRLRRCQSSADCRSGERCDNDEACIQPRTFDSQGGTMPVPGTGSCLGACVPTGCAGFGENLCSDHPECDGGTFATVCHPKPYCGGHGGPIEDPPPPGPGPIVPGGPTPGDPGGVGGNCGCEPEFTGCAPQSPQDGIRPERSLLVRDPEIVSDPFFRIDNVLTRLAPAGQVDEFVKGWFNQIGAAIQLPGGSATQARTGFQGFLADLGKNNQLSAAGLAQLYHTTALANRIDLASAGDCGEARITFALNSAYSDGNQRMTIIVELRVPDDGNGCRTAAQAWGELSMIDDLGQRSTQVKAIYDALLHPEHVAQVRTNEFLNRTGLAPWELREWHLDKTGMLSLAPVKQTVDVRFTADSGFLTWATGNLKALQAGTAIVPDQYLAAASSENGSRLQLAGNGDATVKATETALNGLACAGCHLTETQSPFTHVGERLGKRSGSGYVPDGRAVIDTFLEQQMAVRAKNLRALLTTQTMKSGMALAPGLPAFRPAVQGRTH